MSTAAERAQDELVKQVTAIPANVGLIVSLNDPYCGEAIMKGAEPLARSLVEAAEDSPKLKAALESITTVGAWGGVATAAMGIAIPIAAHHTEIPDSVVTMFSNMDPPPEDEGEDEAEGEGAMDLAGLFVGQPGDESGDDQAATPDLDEIDKEAIFPNDTPEPESQPTDADGAAVVLEDEAVSW